VLYCKRKNAILLAEPLYIAQCREQRPPPGQNLKAFTKLTCLSVIDSINLSLGTGRTALRPFRTRWQYLRNPVVFSAFMADDFSSHT